MDPGQDPVHRAFRAEGLGRLHMALARVAIESNDFGATERELRWADEAVRELPEKPFEVRLESARATSMWALALARLDRADEARPKAAAGLAFQRELQAKAGDDELHKRDLALALVAAAWTEPAAAKVLLDEAQTAFDSMPADARALRTSRWIDGLIAEARRELR